MHVSMQNVPSGPRSEQLHGSPHQSQAKLATAMPNKTQPKATAIKTTT